MPSSLPHIYTLTGNLLAERTLEFAQWAPGKTQRAALETFQVGGKGINVAKMLNRLGVANTALCFTGGAPGAECEAWLRAKQFAHRAFATTGATRSGTVVRDRSGAQAETTLLGPDRPPDEAAVRACAAFLDAQPGGQVLALCGSFPGWTGGGFDPLRAALARWQTRGILAADTYGPPLAWCAAQPLDLVKLNADELGAFVQQDALPAPAPGTPRQWIVTDGPRPVRWREATGATGSLVPPAVREVSATGSGDVLFACGLYALYHRGLALDKAVAYALPYASANAADPGIAEFPEPVSG